MDQPAGAPEWSRAAPLAAAAIAFGGAGAAAGYCIAQQQEKRRRRDKGRARGRTFWERMLAESPRASPAAASPPEDFPGTRVETSGASPLQGRRRSGPLTLQTVSVATALPPAAAGAAASGSTQPASWDSFNFGALRSSQPALSQLRQRSSSIAHGELSTPPLHVVPPGGQRPPDGVKPLILDRRYSMTLSALPGVGARLEPSASPAPGSERAIPDEIIMQIRAIPRHRIRCFQDRWADRNARVSAAMATTMQTSGSSRDPAVLDQLRAMRHSLGVPQNDVEYKMRFVYPAEDTSRAAPIGSPLSPTRRLTITTAACVSYHCRSGGFVYYAGPWQGLRKTEVVGANHLYFADTLGAGAGPNWEESSMYSMRLRRVQVALPHWDDEEDEEQHSKELLRELVAEDVDSDVRADVRADGRAAEVGGWASTPSAMRHKFFGAETFAWLPPTKASMIVQAGDTLEALHDALLAQADGSFVFQRGADVVMYSMLVRRLAERSPLSELAQESGRAITGRIAEILAKRYIRQRLGHRRPPSAHPRHLLILLGGSGAGKSTLLRRIANHWHKGEEHFWSEWVLSGLDEFLHLVPQYRLAVSQPTVGYLTAAESAYPAATAIARQVNARVLRKGHHLIVEDTGKDLARTKDFIRTLSEADSKQRRVVTVALVDNCPSTAMRRALGRFQVEGRYSSGEYVRHSFEGVFENYCELRREAMQVHQLEEKGEPLGDLVRVDSFIYVDNETQSQVAVDAHIWLDVPGPHPILPAKFRGAPTYRVHNSSLRQWLRQPSVAPARAGYCNADAFQDWLFRDLNPDGGGWASGVRYQRQRQVSAAVPDESESEGEDGDVHCDAGD